MSPNSEVVCSAHMNICVHENKNTNRIQVFPHEYFSAQLFSSSLFLCLLSPPKIISLFLSLDPPSLPPTHSYFSLFLHLLVFLFIFHPALDSPTFLPPSAPSWLFFLSHHHLWPPLPLLRSFPLFLLMQHSLHSCWLLRGKDPAGRSRPNIITTLSASVSLILYPLLSLPYWYYLSYFLSNLFLLTYYFSNSLPCFSLHHVFCIKPQSLLTSYYR